MSKAYPKGVGARRDCLPRTTAHFGRAGRRAEKKGNPGKYPVSLAREEVEQAIAKARSGYESIGRYTPESADRVAAELFVDLTCTFREHSVLLSRISGISAVALWKWRTGRTPIHLDTVSKNCDRFARALGLPLALAEETANLMAGIPWKGRKTGRQLLAYAVGHGLDAAALFHLARRQERMGAGQFARMLGVTQELFSRMSARADCPRPYAHHRGNLQLTSLARRLGLTAPAEIAAFRQLIRNGKAKPSVSQAELAKAFLDGYATSPRSVFLKRFLSLLKQRHGLRSRSSPADAIREQTPGKVRLCAAMGLEAFKQRLRSLTKPKEGCVRVPEEWAQAIASFAFPEKRELNLRLALTRYLSFRPAQRKPAAPVQ